VFIVYLISISKKSVLLDKITGFVLECDLNRYSNNRLEGEYHAKCI